MDDYYFSNLLQKVNNTEKLIEELDQSQQTSHSKRLKFFLVLAFFILLIFIAVRVNIVDKDYNPLRYPTPARIQSSQVVNNMPAIKQIDPIYVTQYKCNSEDHEISVRSNVYWKIGASKNDIYMIQGITGVYTREKGCKTYTIGLKVPPEVYAATNKAYATGNVDVVTWEVVGVDSPIGGGNPVQVVWSTGKFAVLRLE